MVSRRRHGNTQWLLFSRLSGKTCFLFETCAVISGREVWREMSNKRRVCLWTRSLMMVVKTVPALSISVAVLWFLSLCVLWAETEHKSNSSCSDENKTTAAHLWRTRTSYLMGLASRALSSPPPCGLRQPVVRHWAFEMCLGKRESTDESLRTDGSEKNTVT